MKTYRIIQRIKGCGNTRYALQKKSIFGFWYNANFFKTAGYVPIRKGWYDALEWAERDLKIKTTPTKFTVIKTTENQ